MSVVRFANFREPSGAATSIPIDFDGAATRIHFDGAAASISSRGVATIHFDAATTSTIFADGDFESHGIPTHDGAVPRYFEFPGVVSASLRLRLHLRLHLHFRFRFHIHIHNGYRYFRRRRWK